MNCVYHAIGRVRVACPNQVVIGIVGFLIITAASVSIFLRTRKKEQTPQTNTIKIVLDVPESLRYTFNSVKIATSNFSDDKILVKCGFGKVYKGTLENGQEIDVKRVKY
ncbi:putative non-specific serine/threonine protein kinase [Helianthus annuus]|uniref:Non-specific serine/threonine protein kinase n=1 Tax=Helianthus annuus TaxID=4232 RepID=A0A251SZ36_HELAN|nr:putative non-specific serine/threonine protein kinase [Helianthus annuus]KAJ0478200.1 putative non-specific serine/threonine protein kinase [Helianthus annuus]KAJ0499084.1 putative non-specific serine/threonine protein kinase [Helianthus annuus]KAJ0665098.1 putative non-specific serine/threonine protein kinase [Helianthus annuus]KAJ0672516.1 putative non-specific serine/threonine protein kinase [Helianthus annuus]